MTGTPAPDPFTDRQLQALERIVEDLVAERLSARLAAAEGIRDIRLAKTVERSSSYPTSGDTFWIRFLDCAFATSGGAGTTTLTSLERTDEGDTDDSDDVLAREINGNYVEEGAIVFALWQRGLSGGPSSYGEWWIARGSKHATCIDDLDGVVLDDLTTSTSPSYVLGLDSSGCLVKVEVDTC